jgi:adenylate cyclase
MASTKKEKLFSILHKLVNPLAIGIYFTLLILLLTRSYYLHAAEGQSVNAILETIQFLHAKTIDARLYFRGERKGNDRVAILAVDEKAVSAVGRWPWPREKTAEAIEKTIQMGAKVIAADMVFSEKSDRPEKRFIDRLEKDGVQINKNSPGFKKALSEFDSDAQFGSAVQRMANNFILGNFFLYENRYRGKEFIPSHALVCQDLIFKDTLAEKTVNGGETRVATLDEDVYFSDLIREVYVNRINIIKADIRKKYPSVNTLQANYQIEAEIENDLEYFCRREFMEKEYDPEYEFLSSNWSHLKDADPNIKPATFEEWVAEFKGTALNNAVTEVTGWTVNDYSISEHALYNAYFNAFIDNDGVIRSTKLVSRTGSNYVPSIAFLSYLIDQNLVARLDIKPLSDDYEYKGLSKIELTDFDSGDLVGTIPVQADGGFYIDYAGPKHTFAHISIADIIDDSTDEMVVTQSHYDEKNKKFVDSRQFYPKVKKKDYLKDKILVLGATAVGIFDLRNTPFDENFPGVETHANVISNLLDKKFLIRPAGEQGYMLIFLFLAGLTLAYVLAEAGALMGLIVNMTLFFIVGFIDMKFFFKQGQLTTLIFPMILIIGMYVLLTAYKYFTEERAKKELRSTFNKYVSPAIVEEVLKHPKNLELGGRKERLTVFFSDVRGFTTISEKLDPRALSDLLNSYLTPMTELVFKNKGTLDKYMGDAVMAFFGAPIHYEDHAKHACRCALQSLEKLAELQKIYEKKKLPSIDIGIGLNTGECSVGNMGSETVRSYTVMGDSVNLASRLEGINKSYGTHIIISEFTHQDVKSDFLCREVDWVQVKGKLKPVKIFELLAEGKPASPIIDMTKYFEEGYNHYHEKKFEQAIREFEKAIGIAPNDETSKIYIERCREFLDSPPPEDWNGVFIMKSK